MQAKLQAFKAMLPMIAVLQSPSLRPRHWQALEARTGRCCDPATCSLTVQDMLDMNLAQHAEWITGELAAHAEEQQKLEQLLEVCLNAKQLPASWCGVGIVRRHVRFEASMRAFNGQANMTCYCRRGFE